ncbi:plasmid mobilization relaxosome protein MobC [Lactococcus nasutitermitis]|uniref:Plasmid mobilization relaxosome protein MobC n=1 Tax=Lactococcus nasutitermitis TaxID=1652957 RepID=A0ABV9JEH0_9LACT|nr:plasmid mobilization relaxosome protein MobC [Lactococcus nasutitermitis]
MNKQNLNRPIQRLVRFNKDENEYIKEKIKASPFNNFQNFARILLITGEVKMVDYSELSKLNYEVNRIGNNINQMAKLAHQFDEISPADIENLLHQVEELKAMVSIELKKEKLNERKF